MRSEPRIECPCCGQQGEVIYSALKDRLYGVPGEWGTRRCGNADCGTLWLDPCLVPEDIAQAYVDYHTHGGASIEASSSLVLRLLNSLFRLVWRCTLRPIRRAAEIGYRSSRYCDVTVKASVLHRWLAPLFHLFPEKRARVDFGYMFLPVKSSGRLLEVGFGSGKSLERMRRSGWSAEGIDFDEVAVENARQRGLPVKVGDLRVQGYPNDFFDAIVSSHAVEHLHDPIGFLRECWRVLKPGGELVLVTPNAQSLGAQIFGAAWFALDPPRHLLIFTAASLQDIGRKAGFAHSSARFNARDAHNVFTASRHIADSGSHLWDDKGSLLTQCWGRMAQIVEWMGCWWRPSLGEELVVVFRK